MPETAERLGEWFIAGLISLHEGIYLNAKMGRCIQVLFYKVLSTFEYVIISSEVGSGMYLPYFRKIFLATVDKRERKLF